MNTLKIVLFDLDGTLLDTAPDMAAALNQLRAQHQLAALPLSIIRPAVGYGSKALLKVGFNMDESHIDYPLFLEDFLMMYENHLAIKTVLFPEMEKVLQHLEEKNIPWGIVTNKPSRFTYDLLKALKLHDRAACIICGDTLAKRKPDPDQILHACELLKQQPDHCLYVGDTVVDVIASKTAGTKSLVALYGYINTDEDPYAWQADGYISKPIEMIEWLEKNVG